MDPINIGIIGVTICLGLIFLGVPIAICFFLAGVGGILWLKGTDTALAAAMTYSFTAVASFNFAVIPLFVLMGEILFRCGMGEKIFLAIQRWTGQLPGGLAAATTASCAFMGTMTGSSAACAAVMSRVAYPEMTRNGYQPAFSLATIAASGTLASLIPPSIGLTLYAILAEVSIGKQLVAGFVPGVISALIFMIMIVVRVSRNRALGPPSSRANWRLRFSSLRYLLPAAIMGIVLIVGIYNGIFTANEAAGVGVIVALAMVLVTKTLTWSKLKSSILESCRITVLCVTLLIGVGLLTYFVTYSNIGAAITDFATTSTNPAITMILIIIVLTILGMFIGGMGMTLLTVPIFVPIVVGLGYDPIWYGIIFQKMVEVACLTPPVALNVYVCQGIIREVSSAQAFIALIPFIACEYITLGVYFLFPQIILWLPNMMAG